MPAKVKVSKTKSKTKSSKTKSAKVKLAKAKAAVQVMKKRSATAPKVEANNSDRRRSTSASKRSTAVKKRPAAAQRGPARKKVAMHCSDEQADAILSTLTGLEELQAKPRKVLRDLIGCSLGLKTAISESSRKAAVQMVHNAIQCVEETLERQLQEARNKVDDMYASKAAQEAAQKYAQEQLQEVRSSLVESRMNIKESTKAIESFQHGLEAMKAEQITSESKLNSSVGLVDQLQHVDQNLYQPLKSSPAKGPKGRKSLHGIQKIGEDLGVQRSVLKNLPDVLKKPVDKRRTQDGIVMDEFELEVSTHYANLEAALREERSRFEEFSNAVREAHFRIADSEGIRRASVEAYTEAQGAIAEGKISLKAARQSVQKLESSTAKTVCDLSRIEARLQAFRAGVVAAFEALEQPETAVQTENREEPTAEENEELPMEEEAELSWPKFKVPIAGAERVPDRSVSCLFSMTLIDPKVPVAHADAMSGANAAPQGSSPAMQTDMPMMEAPLFGTLDRRVPQASPTSIQSQTTIPVVTDEAERATNTTSRIGSSAPTLGPGHWEADTLAWAPTEVMDYSEG